jgi:Ca-activated chloride channel homolog
VVLLSDGDTNAGRPTEIAAALAKRYGVPVSTIAYGTRGGTAVINGLVQSVPVNADALRAIARTTGGRFFRATTSRELADVYRAVHSDIGFRTEYRDVTLWFGGAAFVLALLTGVVSLAWFSRLP